MADEICVTIVAEPDVVVARAEGRAVAARLGFSRTDATLIATAISEVGRNILVHAGGGQITIGEETAPERTGIVVVARDDGPGIPDVPRAMSDGYGTRNGLGLGLPGARRLMDDFDIETEVGRGTTVTMRKWHHLDELERLREKSAAHG
jgi:serine/threonine-protein kinase RsbT